MIANYGYSDASGDYYITVDTDRCEACVDRWCVEACPESLFEIVLDDYDVEVASIVLSARRTLAARCSRCKSAGGRTALPCVDACRPDAVAHSW